MCRERGVPLHSDCAQAAGKVALDVHALQLDFASLTAHKLYGPKGVGALYVRHGARALLQPLSFGGGQERACGRARCRRTRSSASGSPASWPAPRSPKRARASPRCASGCGAGWPFCRGCI